MSRDTASPSCWRGCWPSQSQRLPRELRSLIARTIPFRVTYENGPWNQRKNTNLISTVGSCLVVVRVASKIPLCYVRSRRGRRTSSLIEHSIRARSRCVNNKYIINIAFLTSCALFSPYFRSNLRKSPRGATVLTFPMFPVSLPGDFASANKASRLFRLVFSRIRAI